MKRRLVTMFIGLVLVTGLFAGCGDSDATETNVSAETPEEEALDDSGEIEESEENESVEEESEDIEKEAVVYNDDGSRLEREFDNEGNMIKETEYYSDGHVSNIREYDNGILIKETVYNADSGHLLGRIMEYTSTGAKSKHIRYGDDGINILHIEEYDSAENMIKRTYYNIDGSIRCWYEYEYDSEGNEIKSTRYNPDGSIDSVFYD